MASLCTTFGLLLFLAVHVGEAHTRILGTNAGTRVGAAAREPILK